MSKLITFITPSRRLANIKGLFDNIEETAHDPSCVEVLIKFDDDQVEAIPFIEEEIKRRPFTIKYIATPRLEGIYSVWVAMEQLFFMSDPSSYFIQIISDEPRFLTPHWDLILRNYIGFYKDDVFRLRLSDMKFASYSSHYECTFRPDSFPIYTRRWLELTEGSGDCWGSDAYQQCVAFQLSIGPGSYNNFYREQGLCRDIPVQDIKLGGLEFLVGVSLEEQQHRHWRNLKEWYRLTTFPMQEHFSYLARRINAYVWAKENDINSFQLVKHPYRKTVGVHLANGRKIKEFSYAVPRLVVYAQNMYRSGFIRMRHLLSWILYKIRMLLIRVRPFLPAEFVATKLRRIVPRPIRQWIKRMLPPPAPAIKEKLTFKAKIRRAARIFFTALLIPFYYISNRIDKWLSMHPPGISMLYKRNPKMPNRIPAPTKEKIAWLKHELNYQVELRQALSKKTFFGEPSSVTYLQKEMPDTQTDAKSA